MVGWTILGVFLGLIMLLLLIPIGADITYEGGEFKASAVIWGLKLQLYPRPPEDESSPKKEKKPKEEKKPEEPEKEKTNKPKLTLFQNLTRGEMLELAKNALNGLSRFGKVMVRRFMFHYTAAGKDPYRTAVTYNYVNAGLAVLTPICRRKFIVKSSDIWTDIDFTKDKTELDFELCIAIRLLQVARVARIILIGTVRIGLKHKFGKTIEMIRNRGKIPVEQETADEITPEQLPDDNNNENKTEDTTQEDERMKNDGK